MAQTPPPTAVRIIGPDLLTSVEFCQITRITLGTEQRKRRLGDVPAYIRRPGAKGVLYPRQAVEDWLVGRPAPPEGYRVALEPELGLPEGATLAEVIEGVRIQQAAPIEPAEPVGV